MTLRMALFLTIKEGKGKGEGVQDSAIMARQKMIYSMYAAYIKIVFVPFGKKLPFSIVSQE